MRILALAAILGVGLCLGAAEAREYRDPAGRIVFDAPANWPVTVEQAPADTTYLIAGNDDNECRFIVRSSPNTANASPYDIWRTGKDDGQFTEAFWVSQANAIQRIFPNNSAVHASHARDDSGFWPMQRAELDSPSRRLHVYGGFQLRPGLEMLGLCINYDGDPPVATFDSVLRSMAHPNDAAFRASAEERIAARAAAEAAAAAAAQQPAPEPQPRRRN